MSRPQITLERLNQIETDFKRYAQTSVEIMFYRLREELGLKPEPISFALIQPSKKEGKGK